MVSNIGQVLKLPWRSVLFVTSSGRCTAIQHWQPVFSIAPDVLPAPAHSQSQDEGNGDGEAHDERQEAAL